MALAVGAVHVDVVPSTKDFVSQMRRDLLGDADKIGRELGEKIGRDAAEAAGQRVTEGLEEGIDNADTERSSGRKGKQSGAAFARSFRSEVRAAIESLPEVDLEANPQGVLRDIGRIRKELEELNDKRIGVDLSGEGALADVRRLQAELAALRDQEIDIDVDFDIDEAVRSLGRLESTIDERARRSAGSFGDTLRRSIDSAISNLPEIDIDADTSEAQAELAVLRDELEAFRGLVDIDLDLNAENAIAEAARLQSTLQAIVDDETVSIDVRVNAAAAVAQLAAIERATTGLKDEIVEVDREIGGFARTIQTQLDSALRNIPDIEIDANTSPARRQFQDLREELEAFRELELNVDLNTDEALRGTAMVMAQLEALRATTNDIDIKVNVTRVLADLAAIQAAAEATGEEIGEAIAEDLDDALDRGLGGFGRKLRDELAKAQATLPEITVRADTSPAMAQVQFLRAQLEALSAAIGVDVDAAEAIAELATLEAAARALDNDDIEINVRADVQSVIGQLVALRAAAEAAGEGFNDALGEETHRKISRIRLILVAVAALFPVIAGALLGITAAFSLLVTPIAAIAVGIEGIQRAAQPLRDDFEQLRDVVAATFESGLQPAIENTARLFPVLERGLSGTARALSTVATGVSEVVTSGENLATIDDSFTQINIAVESLTPALQTFSQNLIDLTNLGTSGLQLFAGQLQIVAVDFQNMIARLEASGTATAAIEALFSVLSSLIGLIGPLTELGSVLLAAFGPALAAAINGIGMVISAFAAALDSLPGPVQTVIAIATTLRLILLALGVSFTTLVAQVRAGVVAGFTAAAGAATSMAATFTAAHARVVAFGASITGLGVASRVAAPALATLTVAARGLLTLLGGPIGVAITAIVVGLSLLGSAQADAAAGASEHAAAVQELSSALQQTGGAITANVVQMTRQKLEAAGAAESMELLGVSQNQVAAAIANGGPAYDFLVQKLQAMAEENVNVGRVATQSALAQRDQQQAAQQLLDVIAPMREQFVSAAEANRQFAEALALTGTSLVGGLANATALEGALAALGNAATTTSDKVKALQAAMDALNGGTVTAEQAAANLEASIDKIGEAFEAAQKAAGETGAALVNASGAIDTTTVKGRELFAATMEIRTGMMEAATTAFDAAGGLNNVEAASAAAAAKVQASRDAFINAATAAGINAVQAGELANRYGLIPDLVVTLLRAEGVPLVQQQLSQVAGILAATPGSKEIRVTALSQEAQAVLTALGIQVQTLPGGEVVITVNDQTKPAIDAALAFINGTEGKMPVTADGTPLPPAIAALLAEVSGSGPGELPVAADPAPLQSEIPGLLGEVTNSGPAPLPVEGDPAPLQGQLPGIIGDVGANPAPLPIEGDASGVPPAAADARNQVQSIPAELRIIPGSLEFINTAIANIRREVSTPVNFSIGVHDNASALITGLRNTASQPITFTLGITDNASAAVQGIRNTIATPVNFSVGIVDNASGAISRIKTGAATAVTFTVGITDNASGAISTIKTNAATAVTFSVGITDNASGAISTIKSNAAIAVSIPIGITDNASGPINDIKSRAAEEVLFPFGITDNASGPINDIKSRAREPVDFTVNALTEAAQDAIDALKRPTSSTHTVNIVVNGTLPRATGGWVWPDFSFFENGGVHNGKLTPMRGNYARVVQPNTFRVIGDRPRDPEAYIPMNDSPRSQSILKLTAAAMGWALTPIQAMASGGVLGLGGQLEDALVARGLLSAGVRTQTAGAYEPSGLAGRPQTGGTMAPVEERLDQMIELLASQADRGGPPITVEDRSGDPVQTARAVLLAQRLAR